MMNDAGQLPITSTSSNRVPHLHSHQSQYGAGQLGAGPYDGRTKVDPVDADDSSDEIIEDDEEKVLPDGEIIDDLVYTILLNKGKTSFDINIGTREQL